MFDEPYTCQDCGAECRGLSFWETCDKCGTKRYEARMAKAREGRAYSIDELGGACPTQAIGRTAMGRPYYFRARHGDWTLEVGEPEWPTDYGRWQLAPAGWGANLVASGSDPSAGWMEDDEVLPILDEHLADR
jgi:hypothetical protein